MPLRSLLLVLLLVASTLSDAQTSRRRAASVPLAPTESVTVNDLTIRIVAPPRPVTARGLEVLAWEMVLENRRSIDVVIERVDVRSGGDDILSYQGTTLAQIIANFPARSGSQPPPQTVRPGELAILYFWTSARNAASVPFELGHRVRVTSSAVTETIEAPATRPRNEIPANVAAPLAGERWLAANGPSNESFHRRAVTLLDGKYQVAQRYAIDWIKLDASGSSYTGDRFVNSNYYAYGADVLAIQDGVVTDVRDGMSENIPQSLPPFSFDTATGNHVILNLGNGRYALYAHLQPGSIQVRTGDTVTRGQVLARIGNSGNSTEPHLHFHVCDANSALACEGLPYTFERFLTPSGGRLNEIPLQNDLIEWK